MFQVIFQGKISVYYQIDIEDQHIDTDRVLIVKAIRSLSPSIRLKDAVKIGAYILNHKCTLVAGIPIDVANHVQTTFAKIGVEAEVNESSIQSPMLLLPNAGTKWKWGFLGIQRTI